MYAHIDLTWLPCSVNPTALQETVWQGAQETWMQILFRERSGQRRRLLIDDGSLVEVFRNLGPVIFRDIRHGATNKVAHFIDWFEKHVSDTVLLEDAPNTHTV